MDAADVLYRNPVVVLREEFDEWGVLYNPDTACAVGINPTGIAIWKQVDGRRGCAQVIQAVIDEFDGVDDSAPNDLSAFIDELISGGFLTNQAS